MNYMFVRLLAICAAVLLLTPTKVTAQRGGRVGVVLGAASVSLKNANDAAAPDNVLLPIATKGFQRGLEFGYNWRFFGVGTQLMASQFGQNYKRGSSLATTRLDYLRPTVFVSANTNTKHNVRAIFQAGGYYGILTNARDRWNTVDAATGKLVEHDIHNLTYTVTFDDKTTVGTLSDRIYYNTDAGIFASLGGEFRFRPKWLVGMQVRMDMGMESLENYKKIKIRYPAASGPVSSDYEHWRNMPYKFTTDLFHGAVRSASTNNALGFYVTLKYVLQSNTVLMYEMDGY